jgi:hypothetical protein
VNVPMNSCVAVAIGSLLFGVSLSVPSAVRAAGPST